MIQKLYGIILLLFVTLFLHEVACTHLETCDCHEIKAIVNKSVETAVARLEWKLNVKINTVISRINTVISRINTGGSIELSDLESNLKSTMVRLLRPIQRQLDYHLPPP